MSRFERAARHEQSGEPSTRSVDIATSCQADVAPGRLARLRARLVCAALRMPYAFALAPVAVAGTVLLVDALTMFARLDGFALSANQCNPEQVAESLLAVRTHWVTALVVSAAAIGAGALLGWWARRQLDRWAGAQIDFVRAIARGRVAKPPIWGLTGALGRLEQMNARTAADYRTWVERMRRELSTQRTAVEVRRALEYADNEVDVVRLFARALRKILPGRPVEVLLADSSRSHLRGLVHIGDEKGCGVRAPSACAAIRTGTTLRMEVSTAIDACPRLEEAGLTDCSALCVPLNVMGNTIGVVTTRGAPRDLPSEETEEILELMTAYTSSRLSVIRSLQSATVRARTDGLTGLLNRVAFEEAAEELIERNEGPHAFVMADLDHFKRLNDTAGHAAGDRALRVFAHQLRAFFGGDALVGRWGGEEFALMLPQCSASEARERLDVFRAELAQVLHRTGSVRFTVSMGVAEWPADGMTLEELAVAADDALYEAKRAGRDCVVVAAEVGNTAPGLSVGGNQGGEERAAISMS